jgi:predicted DNA-binding transcriptional regulator AlpA
MAAATPLRQGTAAPLTGAHAVMTSAEVGRLLQVSHATLCRWRQRGSGPRVLWLSARVPRYLRTDVQQWMEQARS